MKAIWQRRCDIVHLKEGKAVSRRERKTLKKEIRQQYALDPDGARARDKELLQSPIKALLRSSVRNQRYSIHTLKSSRAFFTDFETNMFSEMHSVKRRWTALPI